MRDQINNALNPGNSLDRSDRNPLSIGKLKFLNENYYLLLMPILLLHFLI